MNTRRLSAGPRPPERWRAVYTVAGAVTVAVGVLNGMGPVQGLLSGCSLTVEPVGWRLTGSSSCRYVLDVLPVLIPLVAGVLLLVAAWRYHHLDRVSTVITGLAIPTAVAIALFPLYTVWWLIDYYRLSLGLTEAILLLLALAVLGVAMRAGWVTARYLLGRGRP